MRSNFIEEIQYMFLSCDRFPWKLATISPQNILRVPVIVGVNMGLNLPEQFPECLA